jgi:hypothetical protein
MWSRLMGPIILTIISLAKGFQENLGNYKYSVLFHNHNKSLKQTKLDTFYYIREIQLVLQIQNILNGFSFTCSY